MREKRQSLDRLHVARTFVKAKSVPELPNNLSLFPNPRLFFSAPVEIQEVEFGQVLIICWNDGR